MSHHANGKSVARTNSGTNTPPATTPNPPSHMLATNALAPIGTPPMNAPKFGTLIPNRIFVGGIPAPTTEGELLQLFSNYGTVKAAKIIQDRAGVSKGYGFVTFDNEEDARRLHGEPDSHVFLRDKRLNIAPAIKKQPFSRSFGRSSPITYTTSTCIPASGVPYFHSGLTYFSQPPSAEVNNTQSPVFQRSVVYPTQSSLPQTAGFPSLLYSPSLYVPQQYQYQPLPYGPAMYANAASQLLANSSAESFQQPDDAELPELPGSTFYDPAPNPGPFMHNYGPVYVNRLFETASAGQAGVGMPPLGSYGRPEFANQLEQAQSPDDSFYNMSSAEGNSCLPRPLLSLLDLDDDQETHHVRPLQSGIGQDPFRPINNDYDQYHPFTHQLDAAAFHLRSSAYARTKILYNIQRLNNCTNTRGRGQNPTGIATGLSRPSAPMARNSPSPPVPPNVSAHFNRRSEASVHSSPRARRRLSSRRVRFNTESEDQDMFDN